MKNLNKKIEKYLVNESNKKLWKLKSTEWDTRVKASNLEIDNTLSQMEDEIDEIKDLLNALVDVVGSKK